MRAHVHEVIVLRAAEGEVGGEELALALGEKTDMVCAGRVEERRKGRSWWMKRMRE